MPLIPDYLVYASMFYLSFMGVWCSRQSILLDPLNFVIFIPQGIMYVIFDMIDFPPALRAPYARLSLFLIPAVLSLTLTFQYWRRTIISWK